MSKLHLPSGVLRVTFFAFTSLAWFTTPASADDGAFTGAGGNSLWGTAENWFGSNIADGSGSTGTFGTGGASADLLNTSRNLGTIIFNRDANFEILSTGSGTLTVGTISAAAPNVSFPRGYTISAPAALAGTNTWNTGTVTTLTMSGAISGSALGITKSGTGTLVLSGSNTFTGALSINGGTAVINSVADWGSPSAIGAGANEGTSQFPLGPFLSIDNATLRYVGTGHSTNRTFALDPNGGTLDASGSGAISMKNWQVVRRGGSSGDRTLTLTGTSTAANTFGLVLFDGELGGGSFSLTKTGSGKWVIPTSVPNQPGGVAFRNQYAGPTRILGGVLEVHADNLSDFGGVGGGLADGGANSGIGKSSSAPENLVLDAGTLRYVYVGLTNTATLALKAHDAGQINRLFTVGLGGGTIDVSRPATGSNNLGGPVNFANGGSLGTLGSGARTLYLKGDYADGVDGTNFYCAIGAVIHDNGGATSIVKDGPGEWVLYGASDYTGSTTINDGTLLIAHSGGNRLPIATNVTINGTGELELYTGDSGSFTHGGGAHPPESFTQTIGSLNGGSLSFVTLNAGTLIVDNTTTSTYSGTVTENRDGGSAEEQEGGHLTKSNTGTLILSGALSYTGGTTVNHGTLIVSRLSTGTDSEFTNGPLVISAGAGSVATMRVTDKGTSNNNDLSGTSIVSSLSITAGAGGTATLDLTNNSMIINYPDEVDTLEDDIRQHMQPGRLTTSVTTFNGYGTRLGYADNAELGAYARTTFSDVDVDSSNLLIMFTYAGDATLDGVVNSDDFNELAGNFGTGTRWREGDFTYGGEVNSDDFNLLAGNFGQNGLAARGRPPLADLYVLMLDYPLVYWSARLRPDIWWRFEEFETWGLGEPPEMPDGVMGLVPEPGTLAVLVGLAAMHRRSRQSFRSD